VHRWRLNLAAQHNDAMGRLQKSPPCTDAVLMRARSRPMDGVFGVSILGVTNEEDGRFLGRPPCKSHNGLAALITTDDLM
jgi:hypothetical protein